MVKQYLGMVGLMCALARGTSDRVRVGRNEVRVRVRARVTGPDSGFY